MNPSVVEPAPSRRRPGRLRLFAGVTIAPLAWALHLLVSYSIAAYACFPTDMALGVPVWTQLRAIVAAVTAVLWVVALAGCALAWANWTATRSDAEVAPHRMLQTGDGRARFMSLCGILVSGLFAIALVFTSAGVLWVPDCGL